MEVVFKLNVRTLGVIRRLLDSCGFKHGSVARCYKHGTNT